MNTMTTIVFSVTLVLGITEMVAGGSRSRKRRNVDGCIDNPECPWTQVSDAECSSRACGKSGLCEKFCGVGGYCCRKGYEGCPELAEDASTETYEKYHTCVKRVPKSKYIYKLLHFTF